MKEFGLQLYSVRDYFTTENDIEFAFKALAEMGYKFGQTAGVYAGIDPVKFGQLARDAGICLFSTHYDWDRIKNDYDGTVAYHKAIGADYIGIGGMPTAAREDKAELLKFIDEFNAAAYVYYNKYGYKLTYHNHSFEFKKLDDGKTLFDYLVERLNPKTTSFVLDTYWVQHGGADVRATIERLKGRIDILHLKDMEACHKYKLDNGSFLAAPAIIEVGSGNINFKDIIPLAEKCGVKYFVVEDDRCREGESLNDAKKSADYIKANLLNL